MNIIEERVLINGESIIGATISRLDDTKRPLVLLIMGTGKLDRDGNIKGFKTDLYKNMSDMFVNMGYVCIRYDKRGTHESTGSFKSAGLSDLVNDSAKVIEYAKTLTYVDEDKIIACGHSEGAMIATLLTKQTAEALKVSRLLYSTQKLRFYAAKAYLKVCDFVTLPAISTTSTFMPLPSTLVFKAVSNAFTTIGNLA